MVTTNRGTYDLVWMGYNPKPNYNRVWGYLIMKDKRCFVFWGVRGKKLDFKYHRWDFQIASIREKMIRKGFKETTPEEYEKICPNFLEDLEIWCTTAILADSFK